MFDENFDKNNARRVSQTHTNKRPAFSAYSFTEAGMTFLMVKKRIVSFTLGKVTLFWPKMPARGCPLHQ